jgi:hypothetical protein
VRACAGVGVMWRRTVLPPLGDRIMRACEAPLLEVGGRLECHRADCRTGRVLVVAHLNIVLDLLVLGLVAKAPVLAGRPAVQDINREVRREVMLRAPADTAQGGCRVLIMCELGAPCCTGGFAWGARAG